MKHLILGIAIVTFICQSCNKDETKPSTENKYYPLSVGSYWIYDEYAKFSDSSEIVHFLTDSVFIANDTVIDNNTYSVFRSIGDNTNGGKTYSSPLFRRDSSGYIVDERGTIVMSEHDFSNVLHSYYYDETDTLVYVELKLDRVNDLVTVPAGTFDVVDYNGKIAESFTTEPVHFPDHFHLYYAEGVGLVHQTMIYKDTIEYEERLIKYHIAE